MILLIVLLSCLLWILSISPLNSNYFISLLLGVFSLFSFFFTDNIVIILSITLCAFFSFLITHYNKMISGLSLYFVLLYLVLCTIVYLLFINNTITTISLMIFFTIMILSYFIYLLIHAWCQTSLELQKKQYENDVMISQQENYQHIKEAVDETMHMQHDMKYMLQNYLYDLETKQYETMYLDLKKQLLHIDNSTLLAKTGNDEIDYIISYYYKEIENNHIHFYCSCDKNIPDFHSLDLFVLLGNLLTNAIEAQNNEEVKKIIIHISIDHDVLKIQIKNTCHSFSLNTSKDNASYHGYGLKSVKDILKKCQGTIDYTKTENYLIVLLEIPIQYLS